MIQITIITLICCLLFGVPIAFAIGIAGTAGLYFGSTAPMFMVVKQFFEGINSFSYMAIPLFILAGAIMGKGGISKRIVNFASAILSWLRGGTAITTVGASMIFAAVSGSGAATISAIGGITVPEMLKKGYSRGFTAAMSAGAGSLGPIIPPSVDMIVFGCITGFSISRLFVGGIIPGFIIGLSLMIYCYIYAKKRNIDYGGKFRGKVVWAAFKDSIWALLMPVIIMGTIFGGICTVSEAAAISAFYSAIVGVFIYKTVSIKNLLNTLYETTISVAAIMILVGLSKASAYVVISSQLPQLFMKAMTSLVSSKFVVLLMINVIFLILGCLMEGNCIIVMMVPLMLNLVNSFGIDLIQFGILTCVNIYIGCITPPVGVSLLVGTKLGGASMGGAFKACMPFFLISLVTLLLVSYVPAFSLWLPSLAG